MSDSIARPGNTDAAAEPTSEEQAVQAGRLSLAALISRAERAGKGVPPVETWNPDFCGDIDMVIHADGTWSYNGSPIGRPALVRLFSTVLRKDADGRTFLVTPVEKLGITVEDAPFQAVEMSREVGDDGPRLTFRTNVGDIVVAADCEHPLRFFVAEGRCLYTLCDRQGPA